MASHYPNFLSLVARHSSLPAGIHSFRSNIIVVQTAILRLALVAVTWFIRSLLLSIAITKQ